MREILNYSQETRDVNPKPAVSMFTTIMQYLCWCYWLPQCNIYRSHCLGTFMTLRMISINGCQLCYPDPSHCQHMVAEISHSGRRFLNGYISRLTTTRISNLQFVGDYPIQFEVIAIFLDFRAHNDMILFIIKVEVFFLLE